MTRKLYAFSPIATKIQFDDALAYVVSETSRLSKFLTGTQLQLTNAKVFSRYPEEYKFMSQLIHDYGEPSTIGRSTSIYVQTDQRVAGSRLKNIGIRIPDPYRLQAGCGDFEVENPQAFVASLPPSKDGFIRPFPEMPTKFVELWHPDFDVAGYIVLS